MVLPHRYCGNTTDLVKHMRFNHNTEYEEVMQQQSEDEEKKGAAKKRQTSVTESFGTDRHLSGTERVQLLAEFIAVIEGGNRICVSLGFRLCVDVQTSFPIGNISI